MNVIYPPYPIPENIAQVCIFLAGSIEMGNAPDWQQEVIQYFDNEQVTFLNPRRKDWDSSWKQHKEHPAFFRQVNWELTGLEQADLIVMYLAKGTQSPVSLLELGLFAQSKKMIVCCQEDFWRKGNVDIVCERYGVAQAENLEQLIEAIRQFLSQNT